MQFIKSITINDTTEQHVFEGSNGSFYYILKVVGEKSNIPYDINVPVKWIFDEKRQFYGGNDWVTGPSYCNYCRKQGMWNGVFIGYCPTCAEIHKYERGRGLFGYKTDKGLPYETDLVMIRRRIESIKDYPSIFETYLKNVDVNKIGDKNLEKMYKDGYYCKEDDDLRKLLKKAHLREAKDEYNSR